MKKQRVIHIAGAIVSFICTLILVNKVFNGGYVVIPGNTFVITLLTIGIFVLLIKFVLQNKEMLSLRLLSLIVVTSMVYSFALVVGRQFAQNGTIWIDFDVISVGGCVFVVVFITVAALYQIFVHKYAKIEYVEAMPSKKFYFVFWIIIIICWIPAFLAMFPGNYSYDASPQVAQIFRDHQLNAHHPVLHTLLLDGCLAIGNVLCGDYNVGVAIYSVLQGLILSAIFAFFLYKLCMWNVNLKIIGVCCAFFSLNPFIQIFAFTTTKDTLFSGMLLLVSVFCVDLIRDTESFFENKKGELAFIIVIVLMCLLRNQGKYMLLFSIPFLVLCVKKYRKRLLIILVISLCIVQALLGPVSNAMGIVKGDAREMFCVPMQQLARVYSLNPKSFSEQDKELLKKLIPEEYLERYDEYTADPVKAGFNTEVFESDTLEYLLLWIRTGIDNPKMYIESFLAGSYQYWYIGPRSYAYDAVFYDGAFLDEKNNILGIKRNCLFKGYDEYLRSVSMTFSFVHLPVISIILDMGFPFWLAVFAAFLLVGLRKAKYLGVFILPIMYWGTCLIGPVAMYRYALPMIVCVPMFGSVIFVAKETDNNNEDA